jgi:hypothetical protein
MSTVYNVKSRILNGEDIKREQGSGGVNKKRVTVFLKSLKTKISKDPTKSIKKNSAGT